MSLLVASFLSGSFWPKKVTNKFGTSGIFTSFDPVWLVGYSQNWRPLWRATDLRRVKIEWHVATILRSARRSSVLNSVGTSWVYCCARRLFQRYQQLLGCK
jgi:hypothetical protein